MEEHKYDEAVPGGKFIIGDNYVNADGEILGSIEEIDNHEKAKKTTEPPTVEPPTNVPPSTFAPS